MHSLTKSVSSVSSVCLKYYHSYHSYVLIDLTWIHIIDIYKSHQISSSSYIYWWHLRGVAGFHEESVALLRPRRVRRRGLDAGDGLHGERLPLARGELCLLLRELDAVREGLAEVVLVLAARGAWGSVALSLQTQRRRTSASGEQWMSGGATRQCDRTLPSGQPRKLV